MYNMHIIPLLEQNKRTWIYVEIHSVAYTLHTHTHSRIFGCKMKEFIHDSNEDEPNKSKNHGQHLKYCMVCTVAVCCGTQIAKICQCILCNCNQKCNTV